MKLISSQSINIVVLCLCVCATLFYPFKSSIWYDESVSVLASKGITYDTKDAFSASAVTSADINKLNDLKHVFAATVFDNNNGLLYNASLHYFTLLFGNKPTVYVLFSRIFNALTLICIYFLCTLFFENSLVTTAAILLLVFNSLFWGLGNQVRPYSMGTFLVVASALYLFRYLASKNETKYLLLFTLFSTLSLFTHFFCVYIIFVLFLYLLYYLRLRLFTMGNMLILSIPVVALSLFFYLSHLLVPVNHLHTVVLAGLKEPFGLSRVVLNFMSFTSVNFKIIMPLISHGGLVSFASFILLLLCCLVGNKLMQGDRIVRERLNVVFLLGCISSVFFAGMSMRLHSLAPFYYRYFIFSVPFCCLFIAFLLHAVYSKYRSAVFNLVVFSVFFFPSSALFIRALTKQRKGMNNTYVYIRAANQIISNNISEVDLPNMNEAFLINSFLPAECNVRYNVIRPSINIILYAKPDPIIFLSPGKLIL